jgi:tetratricopeptide (TPR) repeat protein
MRDASEDEAFQYDALIGIAISRYKDFNEGIDYLRKKSLEANDDYIKYIYDFAVGIAYLDSKKLKELNDIADSLLKKYPNHFAGNYLLGYSRATVSRFEESMLFFNTALNIYADNPNPKYYIEETKSMGSRMLVNYHGLNMKDHELKLFRVLTSNYKNFDYIGLDVLLHIGKYLVSIGDFENSKKIINYIEFNYPECSKESIFFILEKKYFNIQYHLSQKK